MLGRRAERQAVRFLKRQGLILVTANYRCRYGEIDLIMRDDDCVVFVEVRYRGASTLASAIESIDRHKRDKLCKTAAFFLSQDHTWHTLAARFDVVAIDVNRQRQEQIEWLRDAFRPASGSAWS